MFLYNIDLKKSKQYKSALYYEKAVHVCLGEEPEMELGL